MHITVLVPAHNEEKVISRTIESLLNQSVLPHQIIVVADNCTDKTVELAKRYKNVTVFETVDNKNKKAGALNQVLSSMPLSEFVLIMDADTILEDTALEIGLNTFKSNPNLGAVCSKAGVLERYEGLNYPEKILHSLQSIEYAQFDSHRVETKGKVKTLQGMCTLFKKEALSSVVGYRKETLFIESGVFLEDNLTEDYELTLCLKSVGWEVSSNLDMKAWTDVPLDYKELYVQRLRWLRGGVDSLRTHGWNKTTSVEILNHLLFLLMFFLRILAITISVTYIALNGFQGLSQWVLAVLGLSYIDSFYRMKYMENIRAIDYVVKFSIVPEMIYGWVQSFILIRAYYLSFSNTKQDW